MDSCKNVSLLLQIDFLLSQEQSFTSFRVGIIVKMYPSFFFCFFFFFFFFMPACIFYNILRHKTATSGTS